MFLFHPIHFLKFLVKSQHQRPYKKGSYKKSVKQIIFVTFRTHLLPSFFPLIIQYLHKQKESVYIGSLVRFENKA